MSRRELTIDTWALVTKQVILRGSIDATRDDISAVLGLIATGKLAPRTTTIEFGEISDALDRLRRHEDVNGRFVAQNRLKA